jgi:hypothetical protein
MQGNIFPLDVISLDPPQQGCDLYGQCVASDGLPYFLKHPDRTPKVPLTEWLCNHLASTVGLPTVGINQLRLRDNTIAFGSRCEANAYSVPDDAQSRLKIIPQLIPLVKNPHIYSACFAFDLFVSNADRHFGNHLYQKFDQSLVVRIIDFSRAFPAYPMLSMAELMTSNTVNTFKAVRTMAQIDIAAIDGIVEKIAKIPLNKVEQLIESAHPTWVDQAYQTDILFFWALEREKRLQQITAYCHELL